MTREEAIERFENVKASALVQKASGVSEYWQNEIDGTIKAIDMAIEALSAKPQTDLISRADAIKAVNKQFFPLLDIPICEEIRWAFIDAITALPSADATVGDYPNDVISRSALMEYCSNQKSKSIDNNDIARFPSADAVQGWRTGKPKKQGEYIVTVKSMRGGMVESLYYGKPLMPNRKVKGMCWYRSDDEWGDVVYDDSDILAWMPLPTPYKGGDDE